MRDSDYMGLALKEAERAEKLKEVPVGAVIVDAGGKVVARAHNLVEAKTNATLHAEIAAINKACRKLKSKYLMGCTMYVSLEPCPMCAAAISYVKISRLVFGALDEKGGAIESGIRLFAQAKNLWTPAVGRPIMQEECGKPLKRFFKERRCRKPDKLKKTSCRA